MGIEVITTEELIGRKMNKETDRISKEIDETYPHPSEQAWEEITTALVKKLAL